MISGEIDFNSNLLTTSRLLLVLDGDFIDDRLGRALDQTSVTPLAEFRFRKNHLSILRWGKALNRADLITDIAADAFLFDYGEL